MQAPDQHSAFMMVPTAAFDELVRKMDQLLNERNASLPDVDALGMEPLRAYTVKEAAHLLGVTVSSVYKIPETELPRVRRNGTAVGFLGINLLCYMHQMPPVDVAGLVERMRRRLLAEAETVRPTVRAFRPPEGGKTRVM